MFGTPESDIAAHIGISARILRKYFRAELDTAAFIANQKVKKTAFNMAVSGDNVAMTIFWLKVRCHWKETSVVQHQDLPAIVVE